MPDSNSQTPNSAFESNETPEDVATLYSWANLHGAKYRDFSAARAQAREAAKQRVEEAAAAERLRQEEEAESFRQEEAQRAAREAAQAAEEARLAEAERLAELARQAEVERQAVLAAQEAQRQAVQQRAWQSQAASPTAAIPQPPAPSVHAPSVHAPSAQAPLGQAPSIRPVAYASSVPVERSVQPLAPPARAIEAASREALVYPPAVYPATVYPAAAPAPTPFPAYPEPQSFFSAPAVEELPPSWSGSAPEPEAEPPVRSSWLAPEIPATIPEAPPQRHVPIYTQPVATQPSALSQSPQLSPAPAAAPAAPPSLTPYVAAEKDQRGPGNRWFALKNVFDPHAAPIEQPLVQQQSAQAPVLAVFSLAGGVGKTSLIASLGRALSARGERILLVDTTAFGLLPFFFGARDQRPGQLRTFTPPGTSLEAPIQLITLDPESPLTEPVNDTSLAGGTLTTSDRSQEWLSTEITRLGRGHHRVLIDLPSASGAITRRILRLNPIILVPVVPDMNSIVSVSAIESFFRNNGAIAGSGKPIQPYYLFNQFDYSLPLHLDVRELLREQIGDRLLPFTLRRSPAVSEALAEGMTVMDYAPSTPLAEDVSSLAGWVRSLAAPAVQTNRGVRWSER